MTARAKRLLLVLALAATAVGAASSCSSLRTDADSACAVDLAIAPKPPPGSRATAWQQIVQLDRGRQAHFATCTPPACPVVTLKTLATVPPAALGPRPLASLSSDAAPATSPSMVESPVAAASQAPTAPTALATIEPSAVAAPRVTEIVVNFAFGSAELTSDAQAAIATAAAAGDIRHIDIRGRTDSVGPAAVNDALARKRATAVTQYLRTHHPDLSTAAIKVDARGACCFAAANDSPTGRARNRRVEMVFWRPPVGL